MMASSQIGERSSHLAPLAGRGRIASAMQSIVRCNPGEGDSPRVKPVDRAPHPDPLPLKNGETAKLPSLFPAQLLPLHIARHIVPPPPLDGLPQPPPPAP